MRHREAIAGLFVVVMLALGGAVILHWRAVQPRPIAGAIFPTNIDWRPASAHETANARATIGGQLAAFHSGDFRTATLYESEMLRLSFFSETNFRNTISSHYPAFCHFSRVLYGQCLADDTGNHLRMDIMLVAKNGTHNHATYFLHDEKGAYHVTQVITDEEDHRFIPRTPFASHNFRGGQTVPEMLAPSPAVARARQAGDR